jgi:glycosyltransferase involved in cell wall biosynthesis
VNKLAFISPLPPAATGIADYSAEVLRLLAGHHALDLFHDQESVESSRLPAQCRVFRASEFAARHSERPYDLAIYQLGNGAAHAFIYDLLPRVPGLLVLHDLVLHHARALMFLDSEAARAYARDPANIALRKEALKDLERYEAETAYCYPAQAERLSRVHLGTVGALLPYAYPLFRLPVEASRVTAVHNAFMADAIRDEVPGVRVTTIPMAAQRVTVSDSDAAAVRRRYWLAPDDYVVASFGLLTREKRIETVARAVARAAVHLPKLRLLLVGPVPDRNELLEMLGGLGIAKRTVVAGRVAFEELPVHMEVADLAVHLRYPTARETSAALLRLLAQGRPVVVSDLAHQAEIPADVVVRADVGDEEGEVTRAILNLAERPHQRRRLGEKAQAFVNERHSPAMCRAGYDAAIGAALLAPAPETDKWPEHWRPA